MSDRAQFTTPSAARWLVTAAIAVVVLALVVEEALSAPALAAGEVEQVCGLCHVEWWRPLGIFAVASGLTAVAHWLVGGPNRSPEEDGDE
ncbi:hypothetical protein PM085_15775 [Halorubrum ezzemoulense]|uniref:Uncharacterized protein n=1 Tax=Halorubrum ezzemoulense TaxID=337243 RepID=A0ABT4Z6C5_HALEZ|nr:hypothetical protein [Halorubrum ezzemoulense]MDB2293716.1 hypothetical protein [Halorubrum ezzemoulense]